MSPEHIERIEQHWDDLAPSQPSELACLQQELARLRQQVAAYESAASQPMLFADGREPSENERHLANLLAWRGREAAQLKDEIRLLREASHARVMFD